MITDELIKKRGGTIKEITQEYGLEIISILGLLLGGSIGYNIYQSYMYDKLSDEHDRSLKKREYLATDKFALEDTVQTLKKQNTQQAKEINLYQDTLQKIRKGREQQLIQVLRYVVQHDEMRVSVPDVLALLRQEGIPYDQAIQLLAKQSGEDSTYCINLLKEAKKEYEGVARDYQNPQALSKYLYDVSYPADKAKYDALGLHKDTVHNTLYDWYKKPPKPNSKAKGKSQNTKPRTTHK